MTLFGGVQKAQTNWKVWVTISDESGVHYVWPMAGPGDTPSEALEFVLGYLRLTENQRLVEATLAPQDECFFFPPHAFAKTPQFYLLPVEPTTTKEVSEPEYFPPLPTVGK